VVRQHQTAGLGKARRGRAGRGKAGSTQTTKGETVNIKKSPIWKQAIEDFLASDFGYGDTVPHAWFVDHFGLELPTTARQQKDFQAHMARHFAKFRGHMLKHHLMDFVNVWGSGYLVVKPGDQTRYALKDTRDAIRKALSEGTKRTVFVNQSMLTEAQRQENTDAINKLAALQAIASPKKWLHALGECSKGTL
jgi:hypothetical protein